MKANILTNVRKKKKAAEMANKILDEQAYKRCERCHKERMQEFTYMSKVNAAFNAYHVLDVVCDILGIGQVRFERIMTELYKRDKKFKEDLADGVAFTKLQKSYARRKIYFHEDEIEAFSKLEKIHEKNVIYDPSIKEWRCENET